MTAFTDEQKKMLTERVEQEVTAACDILRHRLNKMASETEMGANISHGTTVGVAEYLFATALSNSMSYSDRCNLIGVFLTRCNELESKMLEVMKSSSSLN